MSGFGAGSAGGSAFEVARVFGANILGLKSPKKKKPLSQQKSEAKDRSASVGANKGSRKAVIGAGGIKKSKQGGHAAPTGRAKFASSGEDENRGKRGGNKAQLG